MNKNTILFDYQDIYMIMCNNLKGELEKAYEFRHE